jgi:hypothetical protein
LFEPFTLQRGGSPYSVTGDQVYVAGVIGSDADELSFSATPQTPATAGAITLADTTPAGFGYWAMRYVDIPTIGSVPAHRREYYSFHGVQLLPMSCEFRLLHRTGGITHFETAWMAADVTTSTVETELDAWYGEGSPGVATIRIDGVVEPNSVQDQPFFQYLPLAEFEVKTAVGGVWAPRGRLLILEVRNIEIESRPPITAMTRDDGQIVWSRWAGRSIPAYNWNYFGEDVGGLLAYSDAVQVVVHTLCRPEPAPDCGGTALWRVEEVEAALQWVLITDDCEGGGTPVAPSTDPSEAGLEETTECDCS